MDLTLARVHSRLDLSMKSLMYYQGRAGFASEYYPAAYADWNLTPTQLLLIDHPGHRRLTLEAGWIGYTADGPFSDLDDRISFIKSTFDRFTAIIENGITMKRIGWRMVFVTEHRSFAELFPLFRQNATRHERSWMQISEYRIRDLGFASVYYGKEDNGLNLGIGILTPEQAKDFLKAEKYKTPPSLDVEAGCLMLDFDRYVLPKQLEDSGEAVPDVFAAAEAMRREAETMATRVLGR